MEQQLAKYQPYIENIAQTTPQVACLLQKNITSISSLTSLQTFLEPLPESQEKEVITRAYHWKVIEHTLFFNLVLSQSHVKAYRSACEYLAGQYEEGFDAHQALRKLLNKLTGQIVMVGDVTTLRSWIETAHWISGYLSSPLTRTFLDACAQQLIILLYRIKTAKAEQCIDLVSSIGASHTLMTKFSIPVTSGYAAFLRSAVSQIEKRKKSFSLPQRKKMKSFFEQYPFEDADLKARAKDLANFFTEITTRTFQVGHLVSEYRLGELKAKLIESSSLKVDLWSARIPNCQDETMAKVFKFESQTVHDGIQAEAEVLLKLSGLFESSPKYYGYSIVNNEVSTTISLFMENCRSTLKIQLTQLTQYPLVEHGVWFCIRLLVRAFSELERLRIVHHNLNLDTILVDLHGSLKIVGFRTPISQTNVATLETKLYDGFYCFAPPEIQQKNWQDYDPYKVDVYSMGVVFLYLCRGQDSDTASLHAIYQAVEQVPFENVKLLLRSMLNFNPSSRPRFQDINTYIERLG